MTLHCIHLSHSRFRDVRQQVTSNSAVAVRLVLACAEQPALNRVLPLPTLSISIAYLDGRLSPRHSSST